MAMTAEAAKSMQASLDPCKPDHLGPALPGLGWLAGVSSCPIGASGPSTAAHSFLSDLNDPELHLEIMVWHAVQCHRQKRPLAARKKINICF